MRGICHQVMDAVSTIVRQEDGTTLVEYALMVLLVAAVAVVAVAGIGTSVIPLFASAAAGF